MGKKSDNLTIANRIDQIYKEMLDGKVKRDILRYASKWKLSERQIENYIDKANTMLIEDSKTVREAEIARAVSRFNRLYDKAFKEQDYKLCKDIQKDLNALLGLEAEKKIDLTSKGEKFSINIITDAVD